MGGNTGAPSALRTPDASDPSCEEVFDTATLSRPASFVPVHIQPVEFDSGESDADSRHEECEPVCVVCGLGLYSACICEDTQERPEEFESESNQSIPACPTHTDIFGSDAEEQSAEG